MAGADDLAAYLRAVEGRFVALRGRGYMLSATDVDLVMRWHAESAPLFVVLRTLEEGIRSFRRDRPLEAPPRSLTYFKRPVAAALRDRTGRGLDGAWAGEAAPRVPSDEAMDTVEPGGAGVLLALEAAGKACRDEAVLGVLREAWRMLRRGLERDQDLWGLTAEVDAAIVDGLVEALPALRRSELRQRADTRVSQAGGTMSAKASAEVRRSVFEGLVREEAGVVELMEVLLYEEL